MPGVTGPKACATVQQDHTATMPDDTGKSLRQATVLVVDDIPANQKLLRETLEPEGYEVLLAGDGATALEVAQGALPDVILLDVLMPGLNGFETCRRLKQHDATRGIPVIFITAQEDTASTVEGFQAGGVDYISKPFKAEEVLARLETHLQINRLTRVLQAKNRELHETNEKLRQEILRRTTAEHSLEVAEESYQVVSQIEAERWGIPGFIGASPATRKLVEEIRKLQPLNATSVLILGESGTGKELIARALHFGSPRAKGPFIPVNCSAVPKDLAESLFFGHLRGAFSGAALDKKGYFQNAENGTIFLDEVADLPLALQAKLLRVLEAGKLMPLGSSQELPINVRVVAATNADVQGEIAAGNFREDLYFRLARYIIELPPLRERREDIPALAEHFLATLAREMGFLQPPVSAEAMALLKSYEFPGNIRELRNVLERALIDSGGDMILPVHLRFATRPEAGKAAASAPAPVLAKNSATSEEEQILQFARQKGSINNAQCRHLLSVGIHRAWYLLRKLHQQGSLQQESSGRWARYRVPS